MNILTLLQEKTPEDLGKYISTEFNEFLRNNLQQILNDILQAEIGDFFLKGIKEIETLNGEKDIRNGYYERTIKTKIGDISLSIPRDRLNYFKTKLLVPYQRNVGDFETLIQNLYLKGLTQNEIVQHLQDTCGTSLSRESIRKIVLKITDEAEAFQTRQLQECAIVFMDGTYVPVKRKYSDGSSSVTKECIEIIMGITKDGHKQILGFQTVPNEGSKSWEDVLVDLKNRGIGEPNLFVTDGLQGMPEAIHKVFPHADHQRCLVHISRNLYRKVRVKDRKEITEDFKNVYNCETKEQIMDEFDKFCDKWAVTYPSMIDKLICTPGLFTFVKYPKEMWQSLKTSNAIESFNATLKRNVRKRIQFNSLTNELILLTTIMKDYNKKHLNLFERYMKDIGNELKFEFNLN